MSRPAHRTPVPSQAPPAEAIDLDVGDLFRAHERTVMRWATRLGGPGIDVEDVVQDVFLIAERRLGSFNGPAKISTWLFRTTEKIVQTARRKQRLRRWLSLSNDANAAAMGSARPTPAEALERDRDVRDVYRVLDRLPDRQRRILILFELEGLSTDEIATLLATRVGTVRVWLFRARKQFLDEHRRLFETPSARGNRDSNR